MFCTCRSDNGPPSSEHGNLRDFLRARRPDLANFRWTLSSYTEKVDVFGNYNVVRCCCVVWWYITSREENRHVSLRDMLSFGWQVCSSPIAKCTLPSDWLEIHCCDDYRLHWAWNFSTVGDAFTGFDFNWICQMVFHNMLLLHTFSSLEILPQEMFWLGLRVELRSHLPPNWSDLIFLIVILGLNFNLSWFHLFTLKHYSPHRWRTLDSPGTSLSASIIERQETARWRSWNRWSWPHS